MYLLRRFQRFVREFPYRANPFREHCQLNCNHGVYPGREEGDVVSFKDDSGEWYRCVWCGMKFPKPNVVPFKTPSHQNAGDSPLGAA